jgi:hypothetical protein
MIPKYGEGSDPEPQQRFVKAVKRGEYRDVLDSQFVTGPNLTGTEATADGPKHKNVLIVRIGLDDDDEPLLAHALSQAFLRWMRDKDTEGVMRSLLADHLEHIVEELRSGAVLDYIDEGDKPIE